LNNPYAAPDAVLSDPSTDGETYEPKVFSVNGRIGRARYLVYLFAWAFAFGFPFGIAVAALSGIFPMLKSGENLIINIFGYALTFVIARRRMHDLDNPGWMALLMFVPFLNFFIGLYLLIRPGTSEENRFGPAPSPNSKTVLIFAWLVPTIAIGGIAASVLIPAFMH
jgi:uncharacterized membrane protein YhaH (DUF805 family)